MGQEAIATFLQQIMPVGDEIAHNIAGHFKPKSFARGELFLEEDKISNEYLFLESGFMRSYLYDTEGNEVTVNFHASNTVVFEVASFFLRMPAQENIQALTDSTGWVLTFEELNQLFHTVPQFRELGRTILVKGYAGLKIRTLAMINKTAEQRYQSLLQTNPEVFRYSPLKYIASYLGITDTSLSRIRKEFAGR